MAVEQLGEICTNVRPMCRTIQDANAMWKEFWVGFLGPRVGERICSSSVKGPYAVPDIGKLYKDNSQFGRFGIYWSCSLKTPLPPHPRELKCRDEHLLERWEARGPEDQDPETFMQVIHSSNMYSVFATMRHGLQPEVRTKDGLVGVFCYAGGSYTAMKSCTGYRIYSSFDNSPYFWGVFYELALDKNKISNLAFYKLAP